MKWDMHIACCATGLAFHPAMIYYVVGRINPSVTGIILVSPLQNNPCHARISLPEYVVDKV
jgi:hypothetical protein